MTPYCYRLLKAALLMLLPTTSMAQSVALLTDSMRKQYHIPELAYAVVSSDSIIVCGVSGVQRAGSEFAAGIQDRFHIGSNTKAITALMAAQLVQQKKLKWDTRFFELFPEMEAGSNKAYRSITLEQLLGFRGLLPRYTYYYEHPQREEVQGNTEEARRAWLAAYFLKLPPEKPDKEGLTPSNSDYILAGLMLERASGLSYKNLVSNWAATQGITIRFGYPNNTDTLQPWGHDQQLLPQAPADSYKLDWLLSAGNINMSVGDYARLMQLFLRGLKQGAAGLPATVYNKLMFGLPHFALGWFHDKDPDTRHHIAWNEGNAGAFVTQVYVIKEADRAYILLSNAATDSTSQGLSALATALMHIYGE